MSIKPILFSTPMVQAILDGRKTMTRRVVKSDPTYLHWDGFAPTGWHDGHSPMRHVPYLLGDVLWVRETWYYETHMHDQTNPDIPTLPSGNYQHRYVFRADRPNYPVDIGVGQHGWRPSIFMPKEAARIFLRVTSVRAERVQDITADDVIHEGVKDVDNEIRNQDHTTHESIRNWNLAWAQYQFRTLWDSLNAKRGFGWDTNPYVWAIEFERVDKPKEA